MRKDAWRRWPWWGWRLLGWRGGDRGFAWPDPRSKIGATLAGCRCWAKGWDTGNEARGSGKRSVTQLDSQFCHFLKFKSKLIETQLFNLWGVSYSVIKGFGLALFWKWRFIRQTWAGEWGRPFFYLHRPTALLAWPVLERPYQVTPLFITSFSQRFQFCHCFSSTIPLSIDLFFWTVCHGKPYLHFWLPFVSKIFQSKMNCKSLSAKGTAFCVVLAALYRATTINKKFWKSLC